MITAVTTVTLNPCIDSRMEIPTFIHGGLNRVSGIRHDIAGKGINVSVALKNLAIDSVCTGFNFAKNASYITRFLDKAAIPHHFIHTEGAIRTNIKLCEVDTGIMTEINQPGAFVPPEAIETLLAFISAIASDSALLILSGSRPPGVPSNIYAELAARWNGYIILDTDGDALYQSVYAAQKRPTLISPNLFELESAFHCSLSSIKEIVTFSRTLNLPYVGVSMGSEGALLITPHQAFYAPAIPVPVRGLPGAGDALAAGFAYGFIQDAPPATMLRLAVAAAAAAVMQEGTLMGTREGFDEMYQKVRVQAI